MEEIILVSDVEVWGAERLYTSTDYVAAEIFAAMFKGTVRQYKSIYIIEIPCTL